MKQQTIYEFGSFRLDRQERLLQCKGATISLTPKAFDLLLTLIEQHGHLLEKDELLRLVWPDSFVEEANLASNIALIRKALGEGENGQRFIETVPKRGYRFLAEVREVRLVSDVDAPPPEQAAQIAEGASAALSKAPEVKARLAWMAAAVLLLGLLATLPFAIAHLRHAPPAAAGPIRFTVAAPGGTRSILRPPEISPDGRNLLYAATVDGKAQLWLRPLGSLQAQPVPGTEDAWGLIAWSPDSRSICFAVGGKLKRLDLAGGQPQTLCNVSQGGNGSRWSRDGAIFFTVGNRIYRVPATGGEPSPVFGTDQPDAIYRWPVFLPDSRHFLYLGATKQGEGLGIYLASQDGKETRRLFAADSYALYASAGGDAVGYLLFARGGALLAAPFDAGSLELTGEPFPIANEVAFFAHGYGFFSVSDNGTLVYVPGNLGGNQQLTWVDRAGKPLGTIGAPGVLQTPRLSPDGKQVAVVQGDSQTRTRDIYVIDLARGASSRLTFDPGDDLYPVWSPDGTRIAWRANRDGAYQLYQKLASGLGPEELLLKSDVFFIHNSWSPDSRYILYNRDDPKTKNDLWVLPLEGERKPFLFLQTPFAEQMGRFSPDGTHFTYISDDQGHNEVFVQPFPASGSKWPISTNGGTQPFWRRDGKEMYFMSNDDKLMAVEVKPGSRFEAGAPKVLFDLAPLRALGNASYTVTPDGQRFLFVTQGQEAVNSQYTVVVNWMAEVKK